MLNDRQTRFVQEYCVDFNATRAYIRAGYSPNGADVSACKLLGDPRVMEAVEARKVRIAEAANISAAFVLREWAILATADPRELVHTRVGCCRYCWGIDHKREWMEHEYATALNEALLNNFLPPAFEGGLGYRPMRLPCAECPRCEGEGVPRNWIADSRTLSPQAAKLFAGTKQTKDGIEIKLRDQDAAIKYLADYFGMLNKGTRALTGPDGGPIQLDVARAQELTDQELMTIASAGSSPKLLEAENL